MAAVGNMHNEAMTSRRRFLQSSSLAAALASVVRARKLDTIGVQLYTVRNVLPEKPAETLRAIGAIGYQEAEASYAGLDKLMPALAATHLKPIAVHLDAGAVLRGKDEDLARMVDEVKRRGFAYVVFPYLPPADRGGLDAIRRLAQSLNRAGEKCRAAGLSFCYHNHAFEFEPVEGTTPFQVLMDNTDKQLVGLEMDAFWVSVAGGDPAEMLAKLGGRVRLMHLKDKAAGTPVMYKESVPRTAFQEVGHGVLDWPRILRAAAAAGVPHYFVEQDQTPGDPVESLRQSFTYLRGVEF
jgi:sugar phosphate isomerase/epimerase